MANSTDVARLFLSDIHAPITPTNVAAVRVWLAAENSNPTLRNNPWNLHSNGGLTGQIGSDYVNSGDRNVAVFDTIEHGVSANANNLIHLSQTNPEYGYGNVLNAFRNGDSLGALKALGASSWAASHYRRNGIPGTNTLVDAFTGTKGAPDATLATASSNPWLAKLQTALQYNSWQDYLDNAFPTLNDIHDRTAISTGLAVLNVDLKSKPDTSTINTLADKLFGGGFSTPSPSGPFSFNPFADVQSAVGFLAVILVGIVFIGSGAIITLRKSQ